MEDNKPNYIQIEKIWKGIEVNEGDGALVNRVVGIKGYEHIDPFLMLDHLKSLTLPGGFPDHPHRGFETVTYSLKGKFLHEDVKGHKGEIEAGDVQWMTAGKGIVHSEMPSSKTEPASGFQLWINLGKKDKMIDPFYQEIKKSKIPSVEDLSGNKVTIIAGKYKNNVGPCQSASSTISFFDINMVENSELELFVGKEMNGFIYVFEGEGVTIGDQKIKIDSAGLFQENEPNDTIKFNTGNSKCRFLLIFGKPLKEKVARYGPFVMNTQEELQQAFKDYSNQKNGFEGVSDWESEIKNLKYK